MSSFIDNTNLLFTYEQMHLHELNDPPINANSIYYDSYSDYFVLSIENILYVLSHQMQLIHIIPNMSEYKFNSFSFDEEKLLLVSNISGTNNLLLCNLITNSQHHFNEIVPTNQTILKLAFISDLTSTYNKKLLIVTTNAFYIYELIINSITTTNITYQCIHSSSFDSNNNNNNSLKTISDVYILKSNYLFVVKYTPNKNDAHSTFKFINVKSDSSYKQSYLLTIKHSSPFHNSEFYLQSLYGKVYFIHLNRDNCNLNMYKVNMLQKITLTFVINYKHDFLTSNIKQCDIQIHDNLIVLYSSNRIGIYDIKQINNDYNVGHVDMNQKVFKLGIDSHYVVVNNNVYTYKFNIDYYYNKHTINNSTSNSIHDSFFTLLRRNQTPQKQIILNNVLLHLIVSFQIDHIINIFNTLFKQIHKYKYNESKITSYNKKYFSINQIVYRQVYQIQFIKEDILYTLFLDKAIEKLSHERKLKLLAVIGKIASANHIELEETYFIILTNVIQRIKNFGFLDSLIKNGILIPNKKFAIFLIERSCELRNVKEKEILFNLGLNVLKQLGDVEETVVKLIESKKFTECAFVLIDAMNKNKFTKRKGKGNNAESFDLKEYDSEVKKYIGNKIKSICKHKVIIFEDDNKKVGNE